MAYYLKKYLTPAAITLSFILFTPVFSSAASPISTPRCNEFIFDATGSYTPDQKTLSYLWDFGDGETSSEPVAKHTYIKSGEYTVTLTAMDNSGLECSKAVTTQKIQANIPPYADFTVPEVICANELINVDGSASSHPEGKKITYNWDFGDGSNEKNQTKVCRTFVKGGDYKISLTVADPNATTCNSTTVLKTVRVNEPPAAEIGQNEILRCVASETDDMTINFDASATIDANNDPISYQWDFNDGQRAEGKEISHRFEKIGNYDVRLVAKDNTNLSCSTGVDFVSVKIGVAPKAEAGDDVIACTEDEIMFDGSNSYAYKKGTILGKWDFGDGESADGLKITHAYKQAGKYQATLSVQNSLNAACQPSKDIRNVTINSRPTVTLNAIEPTCVNSKVHFDAYSATDSDGDQLQYYWTFGDGEVLQGAGPNVTHEYKQGGDYRVSVIIDDGTKTPCSTATAYTTVKVNTPPIADAGQNLTCCTDKVTEFNASASMDVDGNDLSYLWDFGDGTTAEGIRVDHAYSKPGAYNVTLSVSDDSGTSCSTTTTGFTANISSRPIPVITVK